jgi:tRNA threonylcarbamoyladenosine modification (KEOPS) complex Cgi121 subunit
LYFQLPEFSSHVCISGFASRPKDLDAILNEVRKKHATISAQFVDLDKVPGSRYLFLATLNALRSFHSSQPISRTLAMEILLYVSGNRQISEAIQLVGMTSETKRIAVVLVGETAEEVSAVAELVGQILNQRNNDELLDQWSSARMGNVLAIFDIGPKELKATTRNGEEKAQAIERLAIERSALVALRK